MKELSKFDDYRINFTPPGWRYTLVLISQLKWAIASPCPSDFRLNVLEHFEKWSGKGEWLSPEMVAMIEPMPEDGIKIVSETMKLPMRPIWPPGEPYPPSALDVLARCDVFRSLCVINPSIVAALKWRGDRHGVSDSKIQEYIDRGERARAVTPAPMQQIVVQANSKRVRRT